MPNPQALTPRRSPTLAAPKQALAILLLAACGWIGLGLCLNSSEAAALQPLWQKCEKGTGEGQCGANRPGRIGGVAASADTGNVYVVDGSNARINEFSPWGLFLKSWGWGVADGLAKLQTCGPTASPATATCQPGIRGVGAGQFSNGVKAIAADSQDNFYVYESLSCIGGSACKPDQEANRVQKFGPDGSFILMFGKEVNLTAVAEREAQEAALEPVTVTAQEENVCTVASGDTCGRGTQGSGPGEFGTGPLALVDPAYGRFIAIAPGDKIRVGGQERIQVFGSDGHYEESIPVPGKVVHSLAVDSLGNSFVAYSEPGGSPKDNVSKLSPSGTELCSAKVADPRALVTDAQGRLYVVAGEEGGFTDVIAHRFSSDCVEDGAFSFVVSGLDVFDAPAGIATSSACGIEGNLYYANDALGSGEPFLRAYYPQPDATLCPPPSVPPVITDQYAASVGTTSAVVRAAINPRFWPDATYYVEYGTEDCNSAPDACGKAALFPGAVLKGQAGDASIDSSGVFLSGLDPNTTYHYRFVVQSGGGPAHGIGLGEADATFTTYAPSSAANVDCPNQAFRSGSSATLPDCRAYEMVSPVNKNGGELVTGSTSYGDRARLEVGAASGDRVTYSSYRSFPGSASGPYTSQYLASRGASGWSNEPISAPLEGPAFLIGEHLDTLYKGFDEELCSGWFWQPTEPILAPGAVSGYTNLYRRQNCGPVGYEALTTSAPIFDPSKGETALSPQSFLPELEGFSADYRHTIFVAEGKLTEDAPPCSGNDPNKCVRQLYDAHDGTLDLVCILPSGEPSEEPCWAGANGFLTNGRNNILQHAISGNGSRIFWTERFPKSSLFNVGKLYVRIDNAETRPISANPAAFWAASPDGSRAIYSVYPAPSNTISGDLFEADIDEGSKTRIARDVTGVLGISEDARRIYFASTEALSGSEENSEGDSAEVGKQNLYFYEAGEGGDPGTVAFVATLAAGDIEHPQTLAALKPSVNSKTSRITPDGLHAAFTSLNPLTGTDNLDAASGQPVTEVFLYDAATKNLRCVSCNPTNARPQGFEFEFNNEALGPWQGGTIPGWPNQIRPSRVLSDDGQRLFFESFEPLVLTDTNGKKDVYEWEAADSAAECEQAGAQLHLAAEGGCISLISSGESPAASSFVDASANGRDVFFTTVASLLPQDPGLIDLYDAREGGGFPPAPGQPAACEGEACQGPLEAPNDPTPASSTFQGRGNVDEKPVKSKKKKKKASKKKKKSQKKTAQKKRQRHAAASHNNGGRR